MPSCMGARRYATRRGGDERIGSDGGTCSMASWCRKHVVSPKVITSDVPRRPPADDPAGLTTPMPVQRARHGGRGLPFQGTITPVPDRSRGHPGGRVGAIPDRRLLVVPDETAAVETRCAAQIWQLRTTLGPATIAKHLGTWPGVRSTARLDRATESERDPRLRRDTRHVTVLAAVRFGVPEATQFPTTTSRSQLCAVSWRRVSCQIM